MASRLECTTLNIHTTSVCTLKCKKCGCMFPFFEEPSIADIQTTLSGLEKCFMIYDYVEEIRFGGAEAFLYPHINELFQAITKYKSKFGYGIVITNGTYIPNESTIETMRLLQYPFVVRVDNYGKLSKKYDELVLTLKSNAIQVDERKYTNNEQSFAGWVDFGDYSYMDYSEPQLEKVFNTCKIPNDCVLLWNNKLYLCPYIACGVELGKLGGNVHGVIDLSDKSTAEQIHLAIIAQRGVPYEGCRYCNGFDPDNSPRIPAAEQLS